MYELRERQKEASDCGYNSLMNGNTRDFMYATCGFGKSLVIADIAYRLQKPTLILQPSAEILAQNYEKMMSYGVTDVGVYSDSKKRKDHGLITFATIQSIYGKPDDFIDYKYVINDEAHRISPSTMDTMYGKFFSKIGNPARIGLTGSPYRTTSRMFMQKEMMDGMMVEQRYVSSQLMPLNRIFNKKWKQTGTAQFPYGNMIFKAEMMEQIEAGYLCRPEYILDYVGPFDYSTLPMNTTGGDFNDTQLEKFLTEKNRIKQVVQACADYDSKVERNLVFCGSIAQATKCLEYALSLGLKADIITGAIKGKKRDNLLARFKSGEIKHLFNVNVLNTGFDMPNLDCVTFARPTLSVDIWVQSVARVIRKDPNNPNKKAIVIDVCGVSLRMGRIETIRMEIEDGYKDCIVSEVGKLTGVPLSTFRLPDKKK